MSQQQDAQKKAEENLRTHLLFNPSRIVIIGSPDEKRRYLINAIMGRREIYYTTD